jgi:hypothetical protein
VRGVFSGLKGQVIGGALVVSRTFLFGGRRGPLDLRLGLRGRHLSSLSLLGLCSLLDRCLGLGVANSDHRITSGRTTTMYDALEAFRILHDHTLGLTNMNSSWGSGGRWPWSLEGILSQFHRARIASENVDIVLLSR